MAGGAADAQRAADALGGGGGGWTERAEHALLVRGSEPIEVAIASLVERLRKLGRHRGDFGAEQAEELFLDAPPEAVLDAHEDALQNPPGAILDIGSEPHVCLLCLRRGFGFAPPPVRLALHPPTEATHSGRAH